MEKQYKTDEEYLLIQQIKEYGLNFNRETRRSLNTISDQELEDIANATTIAAFKKKLYNLSSAVTVGRLITVLKNLDKKSSYISAAEEYFKELQQ